MSEESADLEESDVAEPTDATDSEQESDAETPANEVFEVDPEAVVVEVRDVDEDLGDAVEAIVDRLATAKATIDTHEETIDTHKDRIEELERKLRRSKADFQNYKKRSKRKQDQIRERATEDLVARLTKVRDNLVRALEQDEDADIRPGVESTLSEFDRILGEENVEIIEPEPGDVVDPERHEVMLRVESHQPAGSIVDVYQPGYEMAEKVLRPAQVTVSDEE